MADHPLSPGGETYAVPDANVLLPPRLSDVLFDLQQTGIYHPRCLELLELLPESPDVPQPEDTEGADDA